MIALDLIESDNQTDWAAWLAAEYKGLRKRFPLFEPDDEKFWPDDYYERLEAWWTTSDEARSIEPIRCKLVDGVYRIEDGWHRFAISKKYNLAQVPVILI